MKENIILEDVISKYTPLIIKYCLPKLNYNYNDSEEVTEEIMITLYKKWDKLKKENIQHWLYRVADKHILKFLSKKAKDLKRMPIICIDDLYEDEEPLTDNDFELFLFNTDIEKYIKNICSQLTEQEQKLFECRYIKKMKLNEIMQITALPYTTLHDNYSKLNVKIRKLIKEFKFVVK